MGRSATPAGDSESWARQGVFLVWESNGNDLIMQSSYPHCFLTPMHCREGPATGNLSLVLHVDFRTIQLSFAHCTFSIAQAPQCMQTWVLLMCVCNSGRNQCNAPWNTKLLDIFYYLQLLQIQGVPGKSKNRILGIMFCGIVLSQRLPRLPYNLTLTLQFLVSQHKPQHSVGYFFLGQPVEDQFAGVHCNSMDCQCIAISCIVCTEGEAQVVSSPELTFLGLCTTTGGLLGDLVPLKKSDSTPWITDPNPAHKHQRLLDPHPIYFFS